MAKDSVALVDILRQAGLSRRRAVEVLWAVRAAEGNCPDEETLAGCLFRWRDAAVVRALADVGYSSEPAVDAPTHPDQLPLFVAWKKPAPTLPDCPQLDS